MYNQPFSQSPGMFGSQSGGAQMQSAPNLPPGNAPGREYFNHSMATFTNAMQPPTGMVPQGISSLVPGYQFGGGVGYGYTGDESVQASIDAAQADFDAAQAGAAAAADVDFTNLALEALQGSPPDVDFTNLALEALQGAPTGVSYTAPGQGAAAPGQDAAPFDIEAITAFVDSRRGGPPAVITGGQTNPTEIDFSNEALNSLQDDSDAQQAEFSSLFNDEVARSSGGFPTVRGTMNPVGDYKDYYDSRIAAARDPEYAKSRQGMYDFLVNDYKGNVVTGGKVTDYEEDGTPIITNELNNNVWNNPDDNETTATDRLNKGFVNSLIKGLSPFQQGPLYNPVTGSMTGGTYVDRGGAVGSGLGSLAGGPFGGLVGGLLGRGRGGYAPVNMGGNSGDFGNPDMEGLPSVGVDISEPDAGDPDGGNGGDPNGDPNGGNGGGSGGSDSNASQYALNPLVYQAYANLGLPVPGNVPPFRRVNIPTSRFVV